VLSALITFGVFVIGHFSADLKTFATSLGSPAARWLFGALFYGLPNLSVIKPGHRLHFAGSGTPIGGPKWHCDKCVYEW